MKGKKKKETTLILSLYLLMDFQQISCLELELYFLFLNCKKLKFSADLSVLSLMETTGFDLHIVSETADN